MYLLMMHLVQHREHASNVGISTHLETAAGYLMEKEIKFIGGVVNDPQNQ